MKRICLFFILQSMILMGCTTTAVINFSDLSSVTTPNQTTPVNVGDSFPVGQVLIHNTTGVKLVVLPFQWSSSTYDPSCPIGVNGWTPDGYVKIVQDNMSGGTGPELQLNNASLGILASSCESVSDLKFKFGDYGGNINLILNGTLFKDGRFSQILNPPINLNVVELPGPLGTLEVNGNVEPFYFHFPCPAFFPIQELTTAVGGQELWIDDVEFTLTQQNN